MSFDRTRNILWQVEEDLHHLAPIPVIYSELSLPDMESFHLDLINIARQSHSEPEIEVPDVRHKDSLGKKLEFDDDTWSEDQIPAIGVWHGVPTNNILDNQAEPIQRLRSIIEDRYRFALRKTAQIDSHEPWISASWIQFYKDGDYKVLHNHERYGAPYPEQRWSGAYYLQDGNPDPSMPYSGMFSFRVRQTNYYIRPKPGLLMLWPADILHEVTPFYGKDERIVINFNINERPIQ